MQDNQKDKFYTETKRGSLSRMPSRMPLIKPYELVSSDDGFTWVFNSPFNEKKVQKITLENISLAGIHDSIIVVYTDMTYLPGAMTQAWLIVNVKNNSENIFTTEEEYLRNIKIVRPTNFQLQNVKDAYKIFNERGEFPWLK